MKAHKLFMLLVTLLLFTQCHFIRNIDEYYYDSSSSQQRDYPPNAQPGHCYGKCMIGSQLDEKDIELAIYTGDETQENVEIQILELEIEPATTRWRRRKKENCLSADPNDCLVFSLEEIPAIIERYRVVTDITATTNFELIKELIDQGGHIEWKEILCPEEVTEDTIHQVQDALRERGYYEGDNFSIMNKEVKSALVAFQKDHHLPLGSLDIETVNMLEIDY